MGESKAGIIENILKLNNQSNRGYCLDGIEKLPKRTLQGIYTMLADIRLLHEDLRKYKGCTAMNSKIEELTIALDELTIRLEKLERAIIRLENTILG